MATLVATTLAVGTIGSKVCMETLTLTCSKTIELISYLATNAHPGFEELNTQLRQCDLKAKVSKIHQLILEFVEKEKNGYEFKKSIKMGIHDLDESITQINEHLTKIKSLHDHHKSLYLNSWRKTNCESLIQTLKELNVVLESRFSDLEKLIVIGRTLN